MAAPRKEIDYNLVDNLCEIQCTGEEIASVLNVDYDTLNARIKEKYNIGFSDYFELKRQTGRSSLRRMQWKLAMEGDKTMLVWLGKQYLNQSERNIVDNNITVNDGKLEDLASSLNETEE